MANDADLRNLTRAIKDIDRTFRHLTQVIHNNNLLTEKMLRQAELKKEENTNGSE